MNKKELFEEALRVLREIANENALSRKRLREVSDSSRESDAGTENLISTFSSAEFATRRTPDNTSVNDATNAIQVPADKKTKYEQHTTVYRELPWWAYKYNDEDKFVVSYNKTGHGEPIMFKTDLFAFTPKIPYGHTLNSLLEKFADIHPDMVVQDAKTGDFYIRKLALGSFMDFMNDFISKRKEQLKNSLTADAILQKYLFSKNISEGSLDKKIREFAKQNPDAVMPTPKTVHTTDGTMRNKRVYAIAHSYLQEFFKFAGLTVVDRPVVEPPTQPTQPKIDPTAPGYKTDPTLQSLSDQEMDTIASRLAGQNITNADDANDAILAEITRIATGREDR